RHIQAVEVSGSAQHVVDEGHVVSVVVNEVEIRFTVRSEFRDEKQFRTTVADERREVFVEVDAVFDKNRCVNHLVDNEAGQVTFVAFQHLTEDGVGKPSKG